MDPHPPGAIVRTADVGTSAPGSGLPAWAAASGPAGLRATLGLVRPRGALADGHVLAALAAAVPVVLLLRLLLPGPHGPPAADPWVLVGLLCFQPAIEELCFRGLLQGALLRTVLGRARAWGLSGANALTGVLFLVAHLAGHTPWQAAAVLVPSLVLGHLRERSGSVFPSLAVHAFYNLAALLALGGPTP